ncbi:PREDICTED: auxin-responsive protein SAUR36-like [Nicotiana attenuata]|uniref:Auxin-responsive protein saur36 n=1 Tax=Nicotiana attenuata TaxID=49451 RepID=A0A314KIR4_NICAT|nr:PREDICTED: auxin-responsive protein SAUR36-like [Nicotiana attenuata]OIT29311.1 auxin-responsive protein saur36 [Nicotiana attenuata]
MKKVRGFRLGKKLVRVFSWFINQKTKGGVGYKRVKSQGCASRAISKLSKCLRLLKHGVTSLCFAKPNSGFFRVGQEQIESKKVSVPKGHLVVYVGEKGDDTCRVVVPVIYFNHPLFAELLREAEMVYGYDHSGGIQIPCRISEFENVQSRIAATGGGGKCRGERSWRLKY